MAGGRVLELESDGQLCTAQYTILTMTKNFSLRPLPPCMLCGAGVQCPHITLYTLYTTQRVLVWQLICVPMFPVTGPAAADSLHTELVTRQPVGVSFENSPSCNINLTTTATVVSQVATTITAAAREILISQATNHIKQPQH